MEFQFLKGRFAAGVPDVEHRGIQFQSLKGRFAAACGDLLVFVTGKFQSLIRKVRGLHRRTLTFHPLRFNP